MSSTTIQTVQLASPVVAPGTRQGQNTGNFLKKWILGLSIPQIILGIACIGVQIWLFHSESASRSIGQGFWAGALFIIVGVVGSVSSQQKSSSSIIAFLILAIFASLASLALLIVSAIECAIYDNVYNYYPYNYYSYFIYVRRNYNYRHANYHLLRGLAASLTIMAVLEGILAITSSALVCSALEKKNGSNDTVSAGQVQYITGPNGEQQMVIISLGQQGPMQQTVVANVGGNNMLAPPRGDGAEAPPPLSHGRSTNKKKQADIK